MLADNPCTFKVVVRDRYDDRVPDFYRTIPIRDGPVPIADQLRRELPYWHPANPVLLDLPPGTGKTTFVYNVLIPDALAKGKNLLLVSNRVALSSQQKRAIMQLLDDPKGKLLTDEGIRQTEDFGQVRVITYHRLPPFFAIRTPVRGLPTSHTWCLTRPISSQRTPCSTPAWTTACAWPANGSAGLPGST